MIDTHSHINEEEYQEDFDNFLEELKENEIENVIIPACEPKSFKQIIDLCEKYDMLYAGIGVHPSEFASYNKDVEKEIYNLCKNHKKVVAIGEIGLDYYYDGDKKEEQKQLLRKQLQIAQDLQLPVLIHDRDAHEDSFKIIQEFKLKDVVYHCFSGDKEFAKKCIDKGYYIAIGGIVTFKKATELKEVAKYVPIEKLLLETDAPYLAPVPFRGKINSPKYLKYIAKEIANLREVDVQLIKDETTKNAKRLFNI